MKLKNAIDKAINKNKSVNVKHGNYKPSDKVRIRIRPIEDVKDSDEHFLVDKHINDIKSMTEEEITSVNDLPRDCFIVQIVEKGENTMGELFNESDVFDESIFMDYVEATRWIDQQGYFN